MIALVRIALSRPYTFVVLALLLLIIGPLAALRTPTDIFPDIRIPVIGVVWQYTGLPPDQMAGRITTPFQRALTTTVNDIEHIVANSYTGFGIIKIFFQPNVDIRTANAQVTAISQTLLRQMPPGATPPLILNYSASTVPILQVALSGDGLTEQNLADIGINQLRTPLVTVPGAAIPYPFGGKQRQVQIDLNPTALQARNLSGQDVANALAAQNLITPVGTQKIGQFEYSIQLNNSPLRIEELGNLPIRTVNGAIVYVRDVATVRDGNPPQTNIVHVDGNRSVLMMVLKAGATSTLDIIAGIKQKVIEVKDQMPEALKINFIGDQSVFVRGAIQGVAVEGVIAALLTSVMILLFLGSWRSTIIIAVSIPLSVTGRHHHAVGDRRDAEHHDARWPRARGRHPRRRRHGHDREHQLPFGAGQAGRAVHTRWRQPDRDAGLRVVALHLHRVRADVLPHGRRALSVRADGGSRDVRDDLVVHPVAHAGADHGELSAQGACPSRGRAPSIAQSLGLVPARLRGAVRAHPRWLSRPSCHGVGAPRGVRHRLHLRVGASFALVPFLGRNFFPAVDAGNILMHVRTQVGTRVEETANQLADIQKAVRQLIPGEIETMTDNIGMPISGINMTYNNTGVIGPQDGDIQIKLKEGHRPTEEHVRVLREQLPRLFPGVSFAFLPADIVSQILNFGAPAPIDLQIRGANVSANFAYANSLLAKVRKIPGVADARIQQSPSNPTFNIDVDRTRAQYVGLTARDVTNSLVVNLAGSSQVAPTYYLNPDNGVSYSIVMQTPQYQMDSLSALQTMPITAAGNAQSPILGGIADIKRSTSSAVVSQYDIQSMIQIFATTSGRDLGAVAADIRQLIADTAKDVPKGSSVVLLGQVQTMNSAFTGLLFGLLGAVVLIYFLIVVNFQSWSDPFVIISALPAALAGIVWMLFMTETTLSVPALTGAIMCMGVATANSVLVISFARERYEELGDPMAAALEAGFVRFRPVLMTALAMIIGMAPMALGLGEGGEQNAPLGRAVIGGLIFATFATLMFVPVVFSMVHKKQGAKPAASLETPHVAH